MSDIVKTEHEVELESVSTDKLRAQGHALLQAPIPVETDGWGWVESRYTDSGNRQHLYRWGNRGVSIVEVDRDEYTNKHDFEAAPIRFATDSSFIAITGIPWWLENMSAKNNNNDAFWGGTDKWIDGLDNLKDFLIAVRTHIMLFS